MILTTGGTPSFQAKNVGIMPDLFPIYDEARAEFERFEDAYQALEWLLARDAESIGKAVKLANGQQCRVYKQAGVAGPTLVPAITVIFRIDVNEVEIVAMRVSAPEVDNEEIEL